MGGHMTAGLEMSMQSIHAVEKTISGEIHGARDRVVWAEN